MALGLHSLGKVKTKALTTLGQPPTKTKREQAASALEGLIRNLAAGVVAAEASGGVEKLRAGVVAAERAEPLWEKVKVEDLGIEDLENLIERGMPLPTVLPERLIAQMSKPGGLNEIHFSERAPVETLAGWFAQAMTDDEFRLLLPLAQNGAIRQTGSLLAPEIEEAIKQAAEMRGLTIGRLNPVEPGVEEEGGEGGEGEGTMVQPTTTATAESIASAQQQLAAFSALTPPEIGEFAFTPSGRGAAAGESQLAASRAAIEEEARKAKIQGFAQLAEAGRRGGAVTSFETALAAEKAGALGKAELEASQTRLGIETAERGQSLNEFIGQKEADLATFDTQAAASASALTGFIDSARTGAEIVQGDIGLFVKNVDSTFQIALARKALGIQKQVAAGQLDIEKGRQAIQAEKVRLEGLQNDLKAQLQPDVIEGLKDKATADKWAGRVSTILGMAGLGAAIGTAVTPGLGTLIGAGGGAVAGVVTAFAPEIFG